MSEILLQIDGKEVKAEEGMTILEAARSIGISIPTLCHHEKLNPYGACRICTVEVETAGRTRLVASCIYPVEKDLVVRTRTEKIDSTRMPRMPLLYRNWLRSMERTRTVLKKSPPFAYFAVYV
jgi:bidirectional [NiFe] hydrogenase diaphorase subunit